MAQIKHQLLIFDRQLCHDPDLFKILAKAFKSVLLLAIHFNRKAKAEEAVTLSICGAEISETSLEIRSILSPVIPAVSILPEIVAAMDLLSDKKKSEEEEEEEASSNNVSVDWDQFNLVLMPHVLFPAQEGYRITVFSKKDVEFNGWLQQPNCVSFQVARVMEINMDADEPAFGGETMHFNHVMDGYAKVAIAPLPSEWEAFFKLSVFETPAVPLIVHFSNSIYSKLIISCVAKPRCLLKASADELFSESVVIFETIARVKTSGICQSLLISESYLILPRNGSKFRTEENRGNRLRFLAALRALHEDEAVLILRSKSETSTKRNFYVLIPSMEEGAFMMNQIASAEMLLPEHVLEPTPKDLNEEDNEAIEQEVFGALKRIPMNDYYDPLEYSSGIVQCLEETMVLVSKKTSRLGSTRGRGKARGKSASAPTSKRKYTPVASTMKKE